MFFEYKAKSLFHLLWIIFKKIWILFPTFLAYDFGKDSYSPIFLELLHNLISKTKVKPDFLFKPPKTFSPNFLDAFWWGNGRGHLEGP